MSVRPCYVNLPLRYIATDGKYLNYFLEHGLNPEIGIDAFAAERLSERWHKRLAAKLKEAGLRVGVHLPFQDLHPGGIDPLILSASRDRLKHGLAIATIYSPDHLVAHALYAEQLYFNRYGQWLDNSIETWTELVGLWPDGPPLFLENVYELNPNSFEDLLSNLPEGRVGFCFDIGHWHSFGGGSHSQAPEIWLDTLSSFLGHMHLHDNDGTADQHLGLGDGDIPLDRIFAYLKKHDLRPSMTLEPHTEDSLLQSLCFLTEHPDWFKTR